MSFLAILYWILIILSVIGIFAPPTWDARLGKGASLVLFILLGLRVFPLVLN